jgi:SPP1 gp7 family putative phage head morphogenesis protein
VANDQPDYRDGTMLALYPDPALAKEMAVPGGLPAEELHVTVAYTGKVDQADQARLRFAAEVAARRAPITAMLSGHARFTGGAKGDVIVALVDSADLDELRRAVVDALTEQGVAVPADHGFTAHMTLQYVAPEDADPVGRLAARPVEFGALSVVYGEDRDDVPFDDGLAALAREAYAIGWAASGGPMTDRVRAGCTAAVELALANAGQPGILEATLHLGHLEGVWAAVFERRLKLHASNEEKLKKAWAKLRLGRHAGRIVSAFRRRHGLGEATGDNQWLTALTQQMADDGMTADEIAGIRSTIEDALRTAAAEGQVDALAVSADQIGQVGFGFDVAFDHAYAALANAEDLLGADKTSQWLQTLLGDQANEVGAALSRLAADGASADEMTAAVEGILSGADSRALMLGTDVLTSRAMSQGALDLYKADGLEQVDYVTAGDQRVCPQCAAAEENGPYALTDAPVPGLHPLCRCTLAPVVPLPGETIDRFLAGDVADEEIAADTAAPAAVAVSQAAGTAASARPAAQAAAQAGAEAEVPADAAPYHLNLNGIEGLARDVAEAGDGTVETLTGGSTGNTYRVTLPDGRTIVHKGARTINAARAKHMADAEQASSLIGRALGLNVPAVYRNEVDAVWMEYLDTPTVQDLVNEARIADRATGGYEAEEDLKDRLQVAIDSPAGEVAGLFDLMIAGHDRNIGNWMVGPDGELGLIDHGNAFAQMWLNTSVEPPFIAMDGDQLFVTTNVGPFALPYVDGEIDSPDVAWAENNLTPADIAEVRERLAALKEEFDLLGLSDWLDYAGRVLDAIEPYADGTSNLIAD